MENQTLGMLQQQFPLSPKKFWKKIMASLVGCLLVVLTALGAATFIQNAFISEICFFVVLVVVVYFLLRAWYIKVYIRRYFYSASDDFVTIKKGVFAPAEIHVQYPKIQDVYVDQDILDRIMGLYDVHIASATVSSGIEAHFDGVEEAAADGLKLFLLDKIRGDEQSSDTPPGSVASSSQTASANSKPLDTSQMISSTQYPISSKWMGMQVIVAFVHALWFSALISPLLFEGGIILVLATFILIFLCQIIYYVIWRGNFHFAFLPDYIQLSTQVIAKSEQHMPYRTVQDVIVKQGIIERMFGLATVSIQNAAANQPAQRSGWGGMTNKSQAVDIPGQTPEDANKIAEIVRSISLTRNSARTGL